MHQRCVGRGEELIDRLGPRSRRVGGKGIRHIMQVAQVCNTIGAIEMAHAQLDCDRVLPPTSGKKTVKLSRPIDPFFVYVVLQQPP
eukprot:7392252-Pyramimonas_sp.AAC.1